MGRKLFARRQRCRRLCCCCCWACCGVTVMVLAHMVGLACFLHSRNTMRMSLHP